MRSYSIDTGSSFEQLILSNIRISYKDFSRGNPYNTTFNIKIVSGEFSGSSEFEYNIKDFIYFIKELKQLYEFKLHIVELNDICYGSNIKFSLDALGHITILGIIYGSVMEHCLTFQFVTDQTAIRNFSNSLYKDFILENKHKF